VKATNLSKTLENADVNDLMRIPMKELGLPVRVNWISNFCYVLCKKEKFI